MTLLQKVELLYEEAVTAGDRSMAFGLGVIIKVAKMSPRRRARLIASAALVLGSLDNKA